MTGSVHIPRLTRAPLPEREPFQLPRFSLTPPVAPLPRASASVALPAASRTPHAPAWAPSHPVQPAPVPAAEQLVEGIVPAGTGSLVVGKLPAITASFWALKMAATTLGETGGDQISESMHVGFLATFFIFMAIFLVAVTAQVRAGRLVPALFWTVIVATSAAGTEMADFIFETIGIGFVSGVMALAAPVILIKVVGRATGGSFSVTDIRTRRDEILYWATILTTNTIGTGVGDGLTAGLGVVAGTLIASTVMAGIAWAYFRTSISRVTLFWAAFVMTRPLGATCGDLLWEPRADGGLGLGRIAVSVILAAVIAVLVVITTRQLELRPARATQTT